MKAPRLARLDADLIAGFLRRRAESRGSTLRGDDTRGVWNADFGDLPREFHDEVKRAAYVVRSYDTPIAWLHPESGWEVPPIFYSRTTSMHQRKVLDAIDRSMEQPEGVCVCGEPWCSASDEHEGSQR